MEKGVNKIRRICLNGRPITIEDLDDLAHRRACLELTLSDEIACKLDAGSDYLQMCVERQDAIYGITTGFGEDCCVPVTGAQVFRLPTNLVRYHGCGVQEIC